MNGRADTSDVLVGDIGGTNCRLAIVSGDGAFAVKARFACRTDAFETPVLAVSAFLRQEVGLNPVAAALSLAGPAEGEFVQLTNSHWRFSRAALQQALGVETVLFVNDLAAQARAVLAAPDGDLVAIGPARDDWRERAVSVVGPGTGLGVALLDARARAPVTPTEGGHVGFAPTDEVERALLRLWVGYLDRVTNEDVISGPGLVRVYRALSTLNDNAVEPIQGPEIMRRALDGADMACVAAVERFSKIFGAVCGDVVLAQGAHACALVGGIATSLAPFLLQGAFRARFEQRGPGERYLRDTPCLLVTTQDLGLRGAAAMLRDTTGQRR